jgi:enoyl-CoA hydratase
MLRVQREDRFEIWTLDRAKSMNAIDHATLSALMSRAHAVEEDRGLRAIILTSTGEMFSSGGDLRELRTMNDAELAAQFSDLGFELTRRLEDLHVPVICAMPGSALGGGAELALACDMRIMDERATISFRHARMGVTTAWGTAERLAATCGHGTASRLLFCAHDLGAKEAYALGLVDAIAPAGTSLEMATAWVQDVMEGGPEAISQMKALFGVIRRTPARSREIEREKFIGTWTSAEHKEKIEAYFTKNPSSSQKVASPPQSKPSLPK